jgi:hypothetical protein
MCICVRVCVCVCVGGGGGGVTTEQKEHEGGRLEKQNITGAGTESRLTLKACVCLISIHLL